MSHCSRCGAAFTCAMADATGAPCWCATLPPLRTVPEVPDRSCWCPDCLRRELADRPASGQGQQ